MPTQPCHDHRVGHVPVDRHEGLGDTTSGSLTLPKSATPRYPIPLASANSPRTSAGFEALPSSADRAQTAFDAQIGHIKVN
jgi:hypothetical protein